MTMTLFHLHHARQLFFVAILFCGSVCHVTGTSSSSSTSFEYMTSYCMKNHWTLSNVDVECHSDGQDDETASFPGDTLHVTANVAVHAALPSSYSIQLQMCKQNWIFASSWSCMAITQQALEDVDFCDEEYLVATNDSTTCGTRGNYRLDMEVPFPGEANFTNGNGSPLYLQAILLYTGTGTGVYEKCLMEFAAQHSQSVAYAWVGMVALLVVGAAAWRKRKRHVLLQLDNVDLQEALAAVEADQGHATELPVV